MRAGSVVDVPDEEPLLNSDLRSGEPDPGCGVHGRDHAVDQTDELPVDVGDVVGALLQNRISDHTDLVGGHGAKATVALMTSSQPDHPGHYFSTRPAGPSAEQTVELILPEGRHLLFRTDNGVFSTDRIDPGTRLLLSDGPPVRPGVLVDVGCGYGPIAITLALRGGPEVEVWAVDVNERARSLCAANAETCGVADRVRWWPPTRYRRI